MFINLIKTLNRATEMKTVTINGIKLIINIEDGEVQITDKVGVWKASFDLDDGKPKLIVQIDTDIHFKCTSDAIAFLDVKVGEDWGHPFRLMSWGNKDEDDQTSIIVLETEDIQLKYALEMLKGLSYTVTSGEVD